MASFFVELWESIFTPGPTPTVLKAANASFAALQVVLLLLLATTYSVHFVVLSVLCGGLWWSINWFATELAAAQAREKEEEERKKKAEREHKQRVSTGSDDSDTEVESSRVAKASGRSKRTAVTATAAAAADVELVERTGELKQRGEVPSVPETQSSVSTEDEWEKVSENEKDKDK